MNINEKIKARREELGLTLEQVANALKVNRSTVLRYETEDIKKMRIDIIEPLAEVLQCTPEYLMGWEELEVNQVPLNLGSGRQIPILKEVYASCGKGEWAEDDVVDYLILPTIFKLNRHKKYFAQVAKGDSMIGAGIEDGNLLIFEVNNVPEDNRIGTFSINNDTCVCKRVKIIDGKMYLVSANDNYPSIEVTEDMDFRMVGLLKYIVKEMMYE